MLCLRIIALVLTVLATASALPPERIERDRARRAAIEPCLKQYPSVTLTGIDDYGYVYARAPEHTDVEGFERCSKAAIEREHLALIGTGKLAVGAAPATVAIRQAYSAFLVPVRINGISATLVLDTGASQTLIKPELARRAGLEVAYGAPRVRGNVVVGARVSVPLVQARFARAGSAAAEDLLPRLYKPHPERRD